MTELAQLKTASTGVEWRVSENGHSFTDKVQNLWSFAFTSPLKFSCVITLKNMRYFIFMSWYKSTVKRISDFFTKPPTIQQEK
jgi:hypothetical protein